MRPRKTEGRRAAAVRGIVAASVLALVAGLSLCAPASAVTPAELAKRWAANEHSAQYRLTGAFETLSADGSMTSCAVEMRRKNGWEFLRFAEAPPYYQGAQVSDQGTHAAVYVPSEERVYDFAEAARNPHAQRLSHNDRAAREGEVRYLGEESVAGRPTWRLSCSARRGAGSLEVWVDQQHLVALRWIQKVGERVSEQYSAEHVNFDPRMGDDELAVSAPDSATTVSVGQGKRADVVRIGSPSDLRAKTGVRAMIPTWLPDGFRFDTVLLAPPAQAGQVLRRRVIMRYIKGNGVLVLAMGANPPRADANSAEPQAPGEPTEVKPGVYFWVKYNVRLALIGPRDTSGADLRRCAESVDWYDR
jgi:hypothetical protein